jgi:hypothetical protein
MKYAIIENGIVSNVVMADDGWTAPAGVQAVKASDDVGIGYAYADGAFTPPAAPTPPAPPALTIYSTLDYFSKFTDAEYQAVRTGPVAIQRGLDMLIAAQYVDVTDPRVTEYLSALVTGGIINDARKAELLEPPAAA